MYGICGWVYGVRVNSRQSGVVDGVRPRGAAVDVPPVAMTAATAVALPSSARLLMFPMVPASFMDVHVCEQSS